MYSISNSSNLNVPILDTDNYECNDCCNGGYFYEGSSNFHMVIFIIICISCLYVAYLMKYDYNKGGLYIL